MGKRPLATVAGFTLIELAVVLAVVGLLVWTVSSSYLNLGSVRDRQAAVRHGAEVRDAIRAFALANARLPCPDTSGDGRAGDCSGNRTQTGRVPYETLHMGVPEDARRAFYGVYRNGDADADLAVAGDRSGNGRLDTTDLIIGLGNAADTPVSTDEIFLTGDDGTQGTIDCAGNAVRNVAFFLVVPLTDRDGDGGRFDSVHTGPCAYAPGTGATRNRDDVVAAEGFASLAGWLNAR